MASGVTAAQTENKPLHGEFEYKYPTRDEKMFKRYLNDVLGKATRGKPQMKDTLIFASGNDCLPTLLILRTKMQNLIDCCCRNECIFQMVPIIENNKVYGYIPIKWKSTLIEHLSILDKDISTIKFNINKGIATVKKLTKNS